MKKYVAFLDILGFKGKLKQLGQASAKAYINAFSSTAYDEWALRKPRFTEGYIVSDSFILYTHDSNMQSLEELLTLTVSICKREFTENKILIRGAVAKGEFDRMPAAELSSLSKGLIVGQAYVDAYTMEDSAKVAGILMNREVYDDMLESDCRFECSAEEGRNGLQYIMSYLNFDYLSDPKIMRIFVELATEANWLPHYYNTLYFALKFEKSKQKAFDLFDNIIYSLGDPGEAWSDIDKFIKNVFHEDVVSSFQMRFLSFIRSRVIVDRKPLPDSGTRRGNRERVLEYIAEKGNVTLSQISDVLGIARSTSARIVQDLLRAGIIMERDGSETAGDHETRAVKRYSIASRI